MLFAYLREHKKNHIVMAFLFGLIFSAQMLLIARVFAISGFGNASLADCSYTFEVYSFDLDRIKELKNSEFGCRDMCIGVRDSSGGTFKTSISYIDGIDEERVDKHYSDILDGVFNSGRYLTVPDINLLCHNPGQYEYFYGDDESDQEIAVEEITEEHEYNGVFYDEIIECCFYDTYETDGYVNSFDYYDNYTLCCSLDRISEMYPDAESYILSFAFDHRLDKNEISDLKQKVNEIFGMFTYYDTPLVNMETKEYFREYAPLSILIILIAVLGISRIIDSLLLDRSVEFKIMKICGGKTGDIIKSWIFHVFFVLSVSVIFGSVIYLVLIRLWKIFGAYKGSFVVLVSLNAFFFILLSLLLSLIILFRNRKEIDYEN